MLETSNTSHINNFDLSNLKPMGAGDILDTTFSLYRKYFPMFLGIASVYFFGNLIEYSLKGYLSGPNLNKLVASLAAIPLVILSMGAIVVATATIYLGGEITSYDALKQALRRLWTLIYCHILWRLVQVGPLVLIALSMGTRSWALPIMVAVIGIPVVIYFSVRWMFYIETVMIEKYIGGSALGRSAELVQGNWWQVCGIIILILLSSYAVRYIFEISLGVVFIAAKMSGGADFTSLIQWSFMDNVLDTKSYPFYVFMTSANLVLNALVLPIWVIGGVLLYFDRRIRKEGYDIELSAKDLVTSS